jgi:hypothetical protein
MTRVLLAVMFLFGSMSVPKACRCPFATLDTIVANADGAPESLGQSGSCCSNGTCTQLATPPAFPVSLPTPTCPCAVASVPAENLALPEVPATVISDALASTLSPVSFEVVYPLDVASTPFLVRTVDPLHSGRDRLTAYSLLLC